MTYYSLWLFGGGGCILLLVDAKKVDVLVGLLSLFLHYSTRGSIGISIYLGFTTGSVQEKVSISIRRSISIAEILFFQGRSCIHSTEKVYNVQDLTMMIQMLPTLEFFKPIFTLSLALLKDRIFQRNLFFCYYCIVLLFWLI